MRLLRRMLVVLLIAGIGLTIIPHHVYGDSTVYVTRSGGKYHLSWCPTISGKRVSAMSVSEARSRGKSACKVCEPDSAAVSYSNKSSYDSETEVSRQRRAQEQAEAQAAAQAETQRQLALQQEEMERQLAAQQAAAQAEMQRQLAVQQAEAQRIASAQIKIMPDGGLFDPVFYAATYPDVVAVFGTDENALYQHYLTNGRAEGRLPYAGANPLQAGILSNGIVMPDGTVFDPVFYAATYPDVAAALGTDANLLFQHYITYGKAEGRYPNASGR